MELICLWVDDYKNLKDTFVNLSPKHKCEHTYKGNQLYLEISKKNDYFSILPDNINLMAIIGENGCGKSSIMDSLLQILKNQTASYPGKYCLVMRINNDYIYTKSENISLESNISIREQIIETNNGMSVGDICRVLSFKPFMENNFLKDYNKFLNIYDDRTKIQDQINNYFVYDRFDESTVAFEIASTIKYYTGLEVFNGKYKNILFDKFGWELNLKDCYNHIVLRLRKYINGEYSDVFPLCFPIVLHSKSIISEFFELINKIVYFKGEKYIWKISAFNPEEILNDITFLCAICEFIFYMDYVEKALKDHFSDEFKNNIKNNDKLGEIEHKKTRLIEEIFNNILNNTKNETPNKIEILERLQKTINSTDFEYNKYIKIPENVKNYYNNEFSKQKALVQNPKTLINLLKEYFDLCDYTYKLKPEYLLSIEKYFKKDFIENTNLRGIDINSYKDCKAVKRICDVLPETFTQHYLHVNLYKQSDKKQYYSFKEMSTGEQRLLKFFADLLYCNPRDVYLIDELDMSWHPEWQRKMIYSLVQIFNNNKFLQNTVNIVIATHSPIPVSDLPLDNIIMLKKSSEDNCCRVYEETNSTFGANIHTLFAKQFFLENTIGYFAEMKINSIIEKLTELNNKSENLMSSNTYKDIGLKECKQVIDIIGENVTKKILNSMYNTIRSSYENNCKK